MLISYGIGAVGRHLKRLRRPEVAPEPLVEEVPRPFPWLAKYPKSVDWHARITPQPMTRIWDDALAAYAERPCLEFLGRTYKYKDIGDLIDRAASGLMSLGVGKGVKVGLMLPNCPYYVVCFFAVLKAGGTVVNFNPLYAPREIARQINDAGCRVIVTLNLKAMYPKVADRLTDTCLETVVVCGMGRALRLREAALFAVLRRGAIAKMPNDEQHVRFEKLTANDGVYEPAVIDPLTDVALLQYTGGTTGIPKGAMLTHANLYTNTVQTAMLAQTKGDKQHKTLAVLPFFHVFGMTGVMGAGLHKGAELILLPRFKVNEVLRAIHKHRPNWFMGVPTMYSAINGQKDLDKYDLSSLEYCISGGAALHKDIQAQFEEKTGCKLVEGYGLTEASPVCTINPFEGENRVGSIGMPVPGTNVEITDLEDPDRLVPHGTHGEICITGPQVMAGYLAHEEETVTTMRGGRLHTGDVGYIDEDGYVYIIDRIKDLIITGGFNVYPRMVEEAVLMHPDVREVVACGVPDKHRGEVVKAFVVLREGASLTGGALRQFLKDKLAPFEMPRRVEFRDSLPQTFIGKPSRADLLAGERRRAKASGSAKPVPEPA